MAIEYKKLKPSQQFELIRIRDEHKKEFFKEHRHDYYELIFITSGYGKHSIDFKEYELKKDLVYLIKPAQVHKWLLEDFNNEYDGYIFLFSRELFAHDKIINNLFDTNLEPAINICNNTKKHLTTLVEMVKEEYNNDDVLMISHLFSAFLKYIIKSKTRVFENSNIDKRVDELKMLIEEHYIKEKSASYYAKELDLTTKRLNEIMQTNINQTVTELISNKILIEAKRELIYSTSSVKTLSQDLGFFDASYFSRFFKKHTSISPQHFREKNKDR